MEANPPIPVRPELVEGQTQSERRVRKVNR